MPGSVPMFAPRMFAGIPASVGMRGVRFRHVVTDREVSSRELRWNESDTAYVDGEYWPLHVSRTDIQLVEAGGGTVAGGPVRGKPGPQPSATRTTKTKTQEEWSTMKKGTQRLSQLFTAMALAGVTSFSMAADTVGSMARSALRAQPVRMPSESPAARPMEKPHAMRPKVCTSSSSMTPLVSSSTSVLSTCAGVEVIAVLTDPVITPQEMATIDPCDLMQFGAVLANFLLPPSFPFLFRQS